MEARDERRTPSNGSLRDGQAGDAPALDVILAELRAMRQELSAARSERLQPTARTAEPTSHETTIDVEYRERFREMGSDYIDTRAAIQAPTGIPPDLMTATEVLSRAAAITEMCAD